ncbi:MAG: hypothetical protein ABIC91_00265 [Nanoarchaeota archaeon]
MMLISVEGSRRSGKTYLTNYLKKQFSSIADFFPNDKERAWLWKNSPPIPIDKESLKASQLWFMNQTEKKYSQAEMSNKKLVFFERDYLSHLSFSYAFAKTFNIDIFTDIKTICERNLTNSKFKRPDLRLICDNNYELFSERTAKTTEKNIETIWSNKNFASNLFDFYRDFSIQYEPRNSFLIEPNVDTTFSRKIIENFLSNVE